jgi:purine-cytosine permease-like protein
MGYWVSIWVAIILEEHLIFRKWRGLGWNWDAWDDHRKLPVGLAALVAFLVGWVGSILSMAQVWYIGPIAAQVGEYGGDMGNYVGFAWAGIVFPGLRWLELRRYGR